MAKDKEVYIKEAVEVIKKENIYSIENLFAYYSGISRGHFYELNLNKSDVVLKALDDNKVKAKKTLLSRWFDSQHPSLQIACYKIIATDDEAHRLNGTKTENKNTSTTTQVFKIGDQEITFDE